MVPNLQENRHGGDAPLTQGMFDKYVMRLEANMVTKADLKADMTDSKADVKGLTHLKTRIEQVEEGTWSRPDRMGANMATKADIASMKEDTMRIRKAMELDDADMAKVKRRRDNLEGQGEGATSRIRPGILMCMLSSSWQSAIQLRERVRECIQILPDVSSGHTAIGHHIRRDLNACICSRTNDWKLGLTGYPSSSLRGNP